MPGLGSQQDFRLDQIYPITHDLEILLWSGIVCRDSIDASKLSYLSHSYAWLI